MEFTDDQAPTLVLSHIAGELGADVSATMGVNDLATLVLSLARPKPANPGTLKVVKSNRELQIENLVLSENLPSHAKKVLTEAFVTDDLVLSEDGQASDGFDTVVKLLPLLKATPGTGEGSGPQTLELSDKNKETTGESSLVKNMKARAARLKELTNA